MRMILAAMIMVGAAACGRFDPAGQEYRAFLDATKLGMPRDMALAHLNKAIALAPDRAQYVEARVMLHIDGREFDAALADLDAALQLRERPQLRFLRGLTLCQSGRPGESLADLDAAIAAVPDKWPYYRARSLARSAAGRLEDGMADAKLLLERAPQQAESYYARGVAFEKMGRVMEAIADYTEAIKRGPELIYPLSARAAAFARTGDSTRAADDMVAVQNKLSQQQACPPCLDPFRF